MFRGILGWLAVGQRQILAGPYLIGISDVPYDSDLVCVIETYNREAVEGIVFFSLLGLASFVAAGVMHWQNRQRKKQSEISQ
ncbi:MULTISPECIES: hypothetical protein [unclassified Pseudomonas]|uniref:hypothetical protein n=1 Tax=unclassified Pseudomonas TaxID=196821 RepID=UPI0007611753|nr:MULTISPECIES: hypothetical protein [unclassified Pseudomonas]